MCATTPAVIHTMNFTRPTHCEARKEWVSHTKMHCMIKLSHSFRKGILPIEVGVWDVDDAECSSMLVDEEFRH